MAKRSHLFNVSVNCHVKYLIPPKMITITLHTSLITFYETMYHMSMILLNSIIPHLWGALKLCTKIFLTSKCKSSKYFNHALFIWKDTIMKLLSNVAALKLIHPSEYLQYSNFVQIDVISNVAYACNFPPIYNMCHFHQLYKVFVKTMISMIMMNSQRFSF